MEAEWWQPRVPQNAQFVPKNIHNYPVAVDKYTVIIQEQQERQQQSKPKDLGSKFPRSKRSIVR